MTRRGLLAGETGYDLWLRYAPLTDDEATPYRRTLRRVRVTGSSDTTRVIVDELRVALPSLLGEDHAPVVEQVDTSELDCEADLLIATTGSSPEVGQLPVDLGELGDEGYSIVTRDGRDGRKQILVIACAERGLLYGVFALLRRVACGVAPDCLEVATRPRVNSRMLDHWDNLDGTVERGFAGSSIWNWYELPDIVSPRIRDYARAMASIGLNATALTNVNANALVLSEAYIEKVRALADVFRPYGVKVFLTARFSAPMELGGLSTADPRDAGVRAWWAEKCRTIYEEIPDFGGFVVKANSEGQPGPQDYGRSHAEGANLLAEALRPHRGVVIWRAFVYAAEVPDDRAKQAYSEFLPLDGEFLDNVMVQVKNGPIDFQPREPHHPLFGAMRETPLMMEFQLTQEYLGNSTHLCYLAPLFSEVLQQETHHPSAAPLGDSRVARVIDGTMTGTPLSGMCAVSNVGDADNWCGHHFAAANWFAFGGLCWDPDAEVEGLARTWIQLTFGKKNEFVDSVLSMMMRSRQVLVTYMTPLGLHHIMAYNHHQGPGPWIDAGRPDWTSTYYHRADETGLGFDRTSTGSNALAQYPAPYRASMESLETCPLDLILWYHHVRWDHRLSTGRTLWDELCFRYQSGVDGAKAMEQTWDEQAPHVDELRHLEVAQRLGRQVRDAIWWKDACLSYFQAFSRRPYPEGVEPPAHEVSYYQDIEQYFVPGIPERRFS